VPRLRLEHAGAMRTETGGPVLIPVPDWAVAYFIQAVSSGTTTWATQTITIGRTLAPEAPAVAHSPAVELTPAAPCSALIARQGSVLVPSVAAAESGVAIDLHVHFLGGLALTF